MDEQPMVFGAELRRRRNQTELSLDDLANLVHYSKSHLSKVERGIKAPSRDMARFCDAVLGCDGALLALVPEPVAWRVTHEAVKSEYDLEAEWVVTLGAGGTMRVNLSRRDMLTGVVGLVTLSGATFSPPWTARFDGSALASYRAILEQNRKLGQRVQAASLLPGLLSHIHVLRAMAAQARSAIRNEALVLASRYADYLGWMAQESGDDGVAAYWIDLAVLLAEQGGDREMATYAKVRRALISLYRRDAMQTVALASAAQESDASPRTRGLAAQREAQGRAIAGEYHACLCALDRAQELLDAPPEHDGSALGTTNVADSVAMARGWCLYDLGRPAEAADVLRAELDRIPADAYRTRARYGARLALALAMSHEIERACAMTDTVLDWYGYVGSATIRTDLCQLAHTLNRWYAHPEVQRVIVDLNLALSGSIVSQ